MLLLERPNRATTGAQIQRMEDNTEFELLKEGEEQKSPGRGTSIRDLYYARLP